MLVVSSTTDKGVAILYYMCLTCAPSSNPDPDEAGTMFHCMGDGCTAAIDFDHAIECDECDRHYCNACFNDWEEEARCNACLK